MRSISSVSKYMQAPPAATSQASRSLLLSPSTSLASPRGWDAVSEMPELSTRYDEVHCVGGGSLLLFLLFCAGKAPRLRKGGRVFFHGPVVQPTAASCAEWLRSAKPGDCSINEYDWTTSAVMVGAGGGLTDPAHQWLAPLTKSIAAGRSHELAEKFESLEERSIAKGRLVHLSGSPSDEAVVRQQLCQQAGEADDQLVRCGQFECFDFTDSCAVVYDA